MNGVLFDTHVVVWILLGDDALSPVVQDVIDRSDVFYVSAVSLYEIAYKCRRNLARGISDALTRLPDDLLSTLRANHFTVIDVTADQAQAAALLPIAHGDPWDRILVAQARDLDVPLVSGDAILRAQAGDTPIIW